MQSDPFFPLRWTVNCFNVLINWTHSYTRVQTHWHESVRFVWLRCSLNFGLDLLFSHIQTTSNMEISNVKTIWHFTAWEIVIICHQVHALLSSFIALFWHAAATPPSHWLTLESCQNTRNVTPCECFWMRDLRITEPRYTFSKDRNSLVLPVRFCSGVWVAIRNCLVVCVTDFASC